MTGNRRRQIVDAAREMLAEDPESSLAVRAVAERVGIGASTLRHHFPTQRALLEAVFTAALDDEAPDLRIHDTSVPARVRLRECLGQLLPSRRMADQIATDRWLSALETTFGADSTAETRNAWAAHAVRTRHRIAGWLRALADEGALPRGHEERGARFLLTVLDGMALARIVPVARPTEDEEDAVLDDALSAVLGQHVAVGTPPVETAQPR